MEEGKQLAIRPEAGTATVENLIASVKRGQVRIPSFQRPLRWDASQVVALFDSIYKGYPIGSLLLQKRAAEAATVQIGPLVIKAPFVFDALWVIDGQQRLTSLAAGLARPVPMPTTPDDAFVVYFDALTHVFSAPPRTGNLPSTWVPVAQLLNASGLIEWVFNWQHSQDADLRTAVFEAGTRLRQYQVPLYTIETDDEEVLRDIFRRTNTFGKVMSWEDVHKALFSNQEEYPSTLSELAEALTSKEMGQPIEQQLLTCIMASQGLDPTRNIAEHSRRNELEKLRHAVHSAWPMLERVLDFLRNEAEIPHLRLLPRSLPLIVLTRYFGLFPQPSSRSLQLLVRWTWRVLLGSPLFDERRLLRQGVTMLNSGNDEKQAQSLLKLVPNILPEQLRFRLPERFDARAAESRLSLLGLLSLNPLQANGQSIDINGLMQDRDKAGLRTIISNKAKAGDLLFSPANRILLFGGDPVRQQLLAIDWEENTKFLVSHAITKAAWLELRNGNEASFLRGRRILIENIVRAMGDRLAAWGQSDRISINQLAASLEIEV
jgi:hypothetical protein